MNALTPPNLEDALREFASPFLAQEPCTLDLFRVHHGDDGEPEEAELAAAIQSSPIPVGRIGSRHRLADFMVGKLIAGSDEIRVLADTQEPHPLLDEGTMQIITAVGMRAIAIIPLTQPDMRLIGIATISWPEPRKLTEEEIQGLTERTDRLRETLESSTA